MLYLDKYDTCKIHRIIIRKYKVMLKLLSQLSNSERSEVSTRDPRQTYMAWPNFQMVATELALSLSFALHTSS